MWKVSERICGYNHLSGLKSLVTICPGWMTRVSFGNSALAKVYGSISKWLKPTNPEYFTTESFCSPIFFPTNLLVHSSVLEPVLLIPGMTRGILTVLVWWMCLTSGFFLINVYLKHRMICFERMNVFGIEILCPVQVFICHQKRAWYEFNDVWAMTASGLGSLNWQAPIWSKTQVAQCTWRCSDTSFQVFDTKMSLHLFLKSQL